MLGDTLRSRIVILDDDLGGAWEHSRYRQHPEAFQFAANLVLYTRDRRPLPGKLAVRRPPAPVPEPSRWITIARVRHRGDWDVCPGAIEQLNRTLIQALSIGVREGKPQDLSDHVSRDITLLWLTGTRSPELTGRQMENLEKYLQEGGMIFADAAAGTGKFFANVRSTMHSTFGTRALVKLNNASPLITGSFGGGLGANVTRVRYTHTVAAR